MKKIYELDDILETLGLLYYSYHFEEVKVEIIQSLIEFGISGETFYQQRFKILDKYIFAFRKHGVTNEESSFFFGDYDMNFFSFYSDMILRNKNYLDMPDCISDNDVKIQMLKSLEYIYEYDVANIEIDSLENIIQFLEQGSFKENIKWKIMCLFKQPKEKFQKLAELIHMNTNAYKKAINTVSKPLSVLLKDYIDIFDNETSSNFEIAKISKDLEVYPTLIFISAQISLGGYCFYGLLNHFVMEKVNTQSNSVEVLLNRLKALSDKSKLQILISLKESPKYNLEIAEQLGLTAATMSHHMNVLLTCGLVGVTKKHGRIYYHVEQENIGSFVKDFQQLFL